jgi:hypothetical protein
MVEVSASISPTTPTLVAMTPEPERIGVPLAVMEQRPEVVASLQAMEENRTEPQAVLMAMENGIEPAAAPLVAMDGRARATQVALVPMAQANPSALAQVKPTQDMTGGFGAVVGPALAGGGTTDDGPGVGVAAAAEPVPSLPPVGVAQTIATTLAAARVTVPPQGVGAEVLLELTANDDLITQALIAYRSSTPGEVLLPLGALADVLGLALTVDGAGGSVQGWVVNPKNRIALDLAKGTLSIGGRSVPLAAGQVARGGDEVFVSAGLLAQMLGGAVAVNFRNLQVAVNTPTVLPGAAAKARAAAWAQATAKPVATDWMAQAKLLTLPFASLPNARLDFNSGWNNTAGLIDRDQALNVQLDGIFLYAGANLGLGLARDDKNGLRLTGGNFRLARDTPSPTLLAEWLGPLAARRIEAGDIGATSVPLSPLANNGRGVRLSNTPAGLVDDPERFVLEGDAPPNWDVEVYQNASLLAFQRANSVGRYSFKALPLRAGVNEFRIVQYGPRGEQETRTARYVLGDAMLARGQITYDVALYEPAQPLLALGERTPQPGSQPTLAQRYAYGLTSNLTAVAAAYVGLGNSPTTLQAPANAVAAGLRGTLLGTYWQAEALAADDATRRVAASLTRQLPFGLNTRVGYLGTYDSPDKAIVNERQLTAELSKPIKISDFYIDNALTYRRTLPETGALTQALQYRTGLSVGQVGVTNKIEGVWPKDGEVNLRGDLALSRPLLGGNAQVGLEYRPDDKNGVWQNVNAAYRVGLTERLSADARYRQTLVGRAAANLEGGLDYQFERFALGVRGTTGSGDYSTIRLNLATQLRPGTAGYSTYNPRRSESSFGRAQVKIYAYVDENGNEVADAGEPAIPGVVFANLSRNSQQTTNQAGEALFTDVPANTPVRLEVVPDLMPDVYLALPNKPLVVYGEAGTQGEYAIPLRRVGEINGILQKVGREGRLSTVAEIQLEAINTAGQVVAQTRSGPDGYFVLGGLPLGDYVVQLAGTEMERSGLVLTPPPKFTLTAKAYVFDEQKLILEQRR